jgi:hypothetical protein
MKLTNLLFLLLWATTVSVLMPPSNLNYAMTLLLAISIVAVVQTVRVKSSPLELRPWPWILVGLATTVVSLPWASQLIALWDRENGESLIVGLGHVVFVNASYIQKMWESGHYWSAIVAAHLSFFLPAALIGFLLCFAAKRTLRSSREFLNR